MPVGRNWRCEYCYSDFALETGHSHFVINPSGSRTFFCKEDCQKAYEGTQVFVDPQIHEVNAVAE